MVKGRKLKKKRPHESIFSFGSCSIKETTKNNNDDIFYISKKIKGKKVKLEDKLNEDVAKVMPSFGTREELKEITFPSLPFGSPRIPYIPPKYLPPKDKKYVKSRFQYRKKYEEDLNFCKHDPKNIPKNPLKQNISLEITIPSPEPSNAKVKPSSPSPSPSILLYEIPNQKDLALRRPKSGIIINETETTKIDDYDSFDLVYTRTPRPGFNDEQVQEHREKKLTAIEEDRREETELFAIDLEKEMTAYMDEGEQGADLMYQEGEGDEDEEAYLTKIFRKKVSRMSKGTSLHSKDYRTASNEKQRTIETLTQKFRHDSELERYEPPPPRIKRGTFESHSFTKLHQTTLKDFYFGTMMGSMHQGSDHFPESSRNKQGICMPIAAYCYALLKHPSKWLEKDVDEILACGNAMYLEWASRTHKHKGPKRMSPSELQRYCFLFDKKIRFKISEPEVTGYIRSDQRNVYNLTKAFNIFFYKNRACIFQTTGADIGVWRDRYFYLFDASPRTKSLHPDPGGHAVIANFYDLESVVSALLDRCMFGNWPFVMYAIDAYEIASKYAPEDKDSAAATSRDDTFNVVNESKAVLLGSFDLADKCFDFTRNKQALPMAVVCLVYSRISKPSTWLRNTVDKIMIVGNQLYIECVCEHAPTELILDQLPAEFFLGPYAIEIFVKPNVYGDFLCRKGRCILEACLDKFFEKYAMSIVAIGNATLAIWKQNGLFYCFDPYSRNIEGHACRNGSACVSMHANLDSLTTMINRNFSDKETAFYVHALVVCRVRRDAARTCAFATFAATPADDLRRSLKRRGTKMAVQKPIAIVATDRKIAELPAEYGDNGLVEIGSDVGSLNIGIFPPFPHRPHVKLAALAAAESKHLVADLDAPSLSDTQIEPPIITPTDDDEEPRVDIDSYELTVEERESIEASGEPPIDAESRLDGEDDAGDQIEEETNFAWGRDATTDVGSHSLKATASAMLSAGLGGFPMPPRVLHPTDLSKVRGRKRRVFARTHRGSVVLGYEPEPDVTQSQVLGRASNFIELPDNSQIVRATSNVAANGDVEIEFVCIMATAVAKKFGLESWSSDIVDYALACGQELFKSSKMRYDQVSRLDIPRVSLGTTDFHITVEYIFDTYLKDNILELALDRMLFVRSDCGIFVTPSYSCAVFYKHHLYYLYDAFGNNEVGLSEGPSNKGAACLMRFKDLRSLVQRIVYNKSKRELQEPIEYTRFVLSRCTVSLLKPLKPKVADMGEDDWIDVEDDAEEVPEPEEKEENVDVKVEVGYKCCGKVATLRGSKALEGRGIGRNQIKEDHFACLCACLMLIEVPIDNWDTLKVDAVIDQGRHIYKHADDLCATDKRIIKNILMRKHFFDVIIKRIQLLRYTQNRNMSVGIDTLFYKKFTYFMIQTVGSCNVLYKSDDGYHLFDPYAISKTGKPLASGKAGWTRYKSLRLAKRRLRKEARKTGGLYTFYTFEVTSIRRAPKKVTLRDRIHDYQLDRQPKKEAFDQPFFEEVVWLNVDPIPWSRMRDVTAGGEPRASRDNAWHNWEIEYAGDLFSLTGNIHQSSRNFAAANRGKQTLCNLVVAVAMTRVYQLSAWNAAVVDSVLVNGDNYFAECVKDVGEEDYELSVDDLLPDCTIFPYAFSCKIGNVVDGTMFLLRARSFNLYKALRYFFDGYESRLGLICVTKNNGKRQVAFGKTRDSEYFVFDCESSGWPMFPDGKAVAYALRMTTLNRLLHVLTLTLRGGDFFVFDVQIKDLAPL